MNDLSTLFLSVHDGTTPSVFSNLNPKIEQEERLEVEKIISRITKVVTPSDVSKIIGDVFGINSQIIFILGDKSIEKELKKLNSKLGKLKVLDFKKFI